ncbi:MAG: histidine phosphatase family protein [Kurthia sp.]|nr:histidine phosphatase family protein [Candidatus Kurthia equi]
MKEIYLVRHCSADGQKPDAQLTEQGKLQAQDLVRFFIGKNIEKIYSSTYTRAVQSVEPLAEALNLNIQQDARLKERVFSTVIMDDWMTWFKKGFENPDLVFEGGESGRDAKARIVDMFEEIFSSENEKIVVASHGNLIAMFLQTINPTFDFQDWQKLSNPDVFLIHYSETDQLSYSRVWDK